MKKSTEAAPAAPVPLSACKLHSNVRIAVREIAFAGTRKGLDEFLDWEVTNRHFPALESLSLSPVYGYDLKLPDTFLRGPDLCDLPHITRLKLYSHSLSPICGFLSSTTGLTELDLVIDDTSQESSFLTCLQAMPCLESLHLELSNKLHDDPIMSESHPSAASKVISPLSELTDFRYRGHSVFLNFLMAGFLAPSHQDVNIFVTDQIWTPIVHLPGFIDAIEAHFYSAFVSFHDNFSISLIGTLWPSFKLGSLRSPADMIIRMCTRPSTTKLATVNKLCVTFDRQAELWEDCIPWRSLLQRFPSVKTLQIGGAKCDYVARTLLRQNHEESDDVLSFLPVLEEIEWDGYTLSTFGNQHASQLRALQPFISARQRAGRPVKILNSSD